MKPIYFCAICEEISSVVDSLRFCYGFPGAKTFPDLRDTGPGRFGAGFLISAEVRAFGVALGCN